MPSVFVIADSGGPVRSAAKRDVLRMFCTFQFALGKFGPRVVGKRRVATLDVSNANGLWPDPIACGRNSGHAAQIRRDTRDGERQNLHSLNRLRKVCICAWLAAGTNSAVPMNVKRRHDYIQGCRAV